MNPSKRFWDRMAAGFDGKGSKELQTKARVIWKVTPYLKESDIVLDFGCGTGTVACRISDKVREVHAVDFSKNMIDAAKRKAAEQKKENVLFTQTTIYDQKWKAASYDVILAIGILHLLNDRKQILKRINELLKPGGYLLASTACKGESAAIPTVMNGICSILSVTGLFPYLNFPYIAELEKEIANSRFQVESSDSYNFGTSDNTPPSPDSHIIAHFVSARKI